MKKKKIFNPIALLGVIGLVGIIGFFGGCWGWFIFFSWFVWFAWIKRPTDERYFRNIGKAARNGFVISMIGISSILAFLGLKSTYQTIIIAVVILFETLLFGFLVSFFYYERRGR